MIEKLREISFFSSMTDFDLQQIAGIIHEKKYGTNAVIIEEKTIAERFFIIQKGKIEISKRFEGGDKAVLSIQSDGSFFGEMAILDEGRRSATVMALEPTTVLEISKEDFDTLLYKAPVLAYRILRELSARLRETGALLISILTQKNDQLHRGLIDTIMMVMHVVGKRSERGQDGSRHATDLCIAIARELGLAESEILLLELSSLLHDLGMLAIPDHLIDRPGPLTPSEYDLVKGHTTSCLDMIGAIPLLASTLPNIRHHHERYDGSGYPDGLSGDAIPLPSRILAVVDAYESMTSGRAYRAPLQKDEAFARLTALSGTQFDPVVLEAFRRARIAPDYF